MFIISIFFLLCYINCRVNHQPKEYRMISLTEEIITKSVTDGDRQELKDEYGKDIQVYTAIFAEDSVSTYTGSQQIPDLFILKTKKSGNKVLTYVHNNLPEDSLSIEFKENNALQVSNAEYIATYFLSPTYFNELKKSKSVMLFAELLKNNIDYLYENYTILFKNWLLKEIYPPFKILQTKITTYDMKSESLHQITVNYKYDKEGLNEIKTEENDWLKYHKVLKKRTKEYSLYNLKAQGPNYSLQSKIYHDNYNNTDSIQTIYNQQPRNIYVTFDRYQKSRKQYTVFSVLNLNKKEIDSIIR